VVSSRYSECEMFATPAKLMTVPIPSDSTNKAVLSSIAIPLLYSTCSQSKSDEISKKTQNM
jgi:hypothetical protein